MLADDFKIIFYSADRRRGQEYFRKNRVIHFERDGPVIEGIVQGNAADYFIFIDTSESPESAALDCTCPRFDDGFPCKHMWAVILHADNAQPNSRQKATWEQLLGRVSRLAILRNDSTSITGRRINPEKRIYYLIDVSNTDKRDATQQIVLELYHQDRKKSGAWGKLKQLRISRGDVAQLHSEVDRRVINALMGAKQTSFHYYGERIADSFSTFLLEPESNVEVLEALTATGRFHWTLGIDQGVEGFKPLACDLADAYSVQIEVNEQPPSEDASLEVVIQRGNERVDNENIIKIADNGMVLLTDRLIAVDHPQSTELMRQFSAFDKVEIPKSQRTNFLSELASIAALPPVTFPPSWGIDSCQGTPRGWLSLEAQSHNDRDLLARAKFEYGSESFSINDHRRCVFIENSWIQRDLEAEALLLAQLAQLPFRESSYAYHTDVDFRIHGKHFDAIIDLLGSEGWKIVWNGKAIRSAGDLNIQVNSGTDWFDLAVTVDFQGETISLPSLLGALGQNHRFVTLADGSRGRIPDALREKYAHLAEFGEVQDDESIRFRPTQAMMLDAMLDAQDRVVVDRKFRQFRKKLASIDGIQPKNPPRGFRGELREYQKEGLGWLNFLRECRLGGCLADDMGLGKTVQVLSLLESRRIRRVEDKKRTNDKSSKAPIGKEPSKTTNRCDLKDVCSQLKRKPSIVVVPKSLVFNWIEEAAKFVPKLKILNYTGTDRVQRVSECDEFDVLITTYGTMRRDIVRLAALEFDYVILDESQAIKNASAQSAKASRLLVADHRLAMTGTPIENHLGELWSLFEFLNPGMLGRSRTFASLMKKNVGVDASNSGLLESLARGLRPFILRRTKSQVLKELPAKSEQTLHCQMLPHQRKQYNELKEYYRVKLAKRIETTGLKKSKIQVLEALLRLRQVACDPRLVDKTAKPGAKLELMQQQLEEVVAEGHKVLVFSQFTALLALVRKQLDAAGMKYEYLDGKTSARAAKVKRFQEDESTSLFLISLKAGGHGLNLTAADYVYLLDPWWNPAVESQAIDRAHRMGQKRAVMAYRIICQDTVEDKILKLQETKRELANSIIRADESLIRKLTADDLSLLLG